MHATPKWYDNEISKVSLESRRVFFNKFVSMAEWLLQCKHSWLFRVIDWLRIDWTYHRTLFMCPANERRRYIVLQWRLSVRIQVWSSKFVTSRSLPVYWCCKIIKRRHPGMTMWSNTVLLIWGMIICVSRYRILMMVRQCVQADQHHGNYFL